MTINDENVFFPFEKHFDLYTLDDPMKTLYENKLDHFFCIAHTLICILHTNKIPYPM